MEIITTRQIMQKYSCSLLAAEIHKEMLVKILMGNLSNAYEPRSPGLKLDKAWTSYSISKNIDAIGNRQHWMSSNNPTDIDDVRNDLYAMRDTGNKILERVVEENQKLKCDAGLRRYAGLLALILAAGYTSREEIATKFPNATMEHSDWNNKLWMMLTAPYKVFGHVRDSTVKQTTEKETMNHSMLDSNRSSTPLFERVALIRGNRADQYSNEQLIGFIKEAEDRIKTLGEVKTKSTYIDTEVASLEAAVKEIAALLDSRIAA